MGELPAGVHTAAELAEHYARVRKRLMAGRPKLRLVASNGEPVEPEKVPFPLSFTFSFGLPFPVRIWAVDFSQNVRPKPTIKSVLRAVAHHYGLTLIDLCSEMRPQRLTRPRQVAYYLGRMVTPSSWNRIGRALHKDHSSVMHGYQKIERLLATDDKLAADVAAIKIILGVA